MDIEYLYKSGKMPLRYYCQQNGKTADENYKLYKDELLRESKLKETILEEVKRALDEILAELE